MVKLSESTDGPAEIATSGDESFDPECTALQDPSLEDPSRSTTVRPSVMHLLMCTTFSAIHLAVIRAIYSADVGILHQELQVSNVVSAILMGVTCTGTVSLMIERHRRGPPAMRQPGHWLLLVPTFMGVTVLAYLSILFSFVDAPFDGDKEWAFGFFAIVFAVSAALYVMASLRKGDGAWRILFLGYSVVSAAGCIFYASIGFSFSELGPYRKFYALFNWGSGIIAVAALGLAMVEWYVGTRRDWLHWAGVVTLVASAAAEVLSSLLGQSVN